jgi:hypothetical protein
MGIDRQRLVAAVSGRLLPRKARRQSLLGVLGLLLAGGTTAADASAAEPATAPTASPSVMPAPRFGQFEWQGEALDTEWHLPPDGSAPRAWVLLQHGFTRRCANLRTTAAHLAARAHVATLCVNADVARGAPGLADALARWWAGPDAVAPDGRPPPAVWVVGGHSAGGLFAARVGAALHAQAPQRLSGALLLDPVGGAALAEALSRVGAQGRRPVRAVMAPPVPCNAQQLALPALARVQREAADAGRAAPPPGVGVVLASGTHVDAEGEDTDALAVRACREGPPQPANVAALRAWSVHWLEAMLVPTETLASVSTPPTAALVPWQPLVP